MATGTGKTLMTVNQIYRLMKSGVARRVLFLVDRRALAAGPAKCSGGQVFQFLAANVGCGELAASATNAFVTAGAKEWGDA